MTTVKQDIRGIFKKLAMAVGGFHSRNLVLCSLSMPNIIISGNQSKKGAQQSEDQEL